MACYFDVCIITFCVMFHNKNRLLNLMALHQNNTNELPFEDVIINFITISVNHSPHHHMISTYHVILLSCKAYVTGPAKIDHLSAKNCHFVLHLLHHNLITIYTNTTKSFLPLENLMGFLLQLTEMECHIQN